MNILVCTYIQGTAIKEQKLGNCDVHNFDEGLEMILSYDRRIVISDFIAKVAIDEIYKNVASAGMEI